MQIPIEVAFRGLLPSEILEKHLTDRLRGLVSPARGVWHCRACVERGAHRLQVRLELDADSGPLVLDAAAEIEVDLAGELREREVRELVERALRDARLGLRARSPASEERRSGADPALRARDAEPACIWYG